MQPARVHSAQKEFERSSKCHPMPCVSAEAKRITGDEPMSWEASGGEGGGSSVWKWDGCLGSSLWYEESFFGCLIFFVDNEYGKRLVMRVQDEEIPKKWRRIKLFFQKEQKQ